MKVKVTVNIPDSGCVHCPYHGHSSFERSYQSYEEKDFCRLFGNVELKEQNFILQRCVACVSCEVSDNGKDS